MLLIRCENPLELVPFLRRDYANNLYFFTYLNEMARNPNIEFLTAGNADEIKLALLVTPIHCCVSTANSKYLGDIAERLPPINSIHVVGRKDLVGHLLEKTAGPEREVHDYSLCEFTPTTVSAGLMTSQRAAESDLYDLVEFYDQNDMLLNASSRLPGILSWGKICFIKIDHEIVSCALTTTETDDAAMIGAVYTATRFRNNGYAKDCILHLCRDLVLEYKKPYLFYRSEDDLLRGFYYSIGFRPISDWILATRK